MTMLDRMRRHKNWLKWSLALVCLAFVIFYIPDFLSGTGHRRRLVATRSPRSTATTSRPASSDAPIRRSCRRTDPRTAPR